MNKLIFPILAIVFVSACIGGGDQTTVSSGQGLEITGFTADQTEIQSGRTLRISMDVENLGSATVQNEDSLAFLIIPGDWSFSDSNEFQNFGKDIDPADSVRGIPAETDQVVWRLLAPTIISGQTRTDEFEGRVYYDYETRVTGNAWLYSETESEAVRSSGGTLSKSSFTSSEGPVKVVVSISPDPVVVSSSDRTFTMTLKITNSGGGIVYKRSAIDYLSGNIGFAPEDLNIVDIDIDSDFTVSSECAGEQELIRGKDLTVICDLTASSSQIPAAKQSFPIEITVDYGYFESKTLSVNVLGR